MNYGVLIQNVESYVVRLFVSHPNPALIFHNLTHTRTVVLRAQQISTYYRLSEQELFIVTAAAWFHDVGYLLGGQAGHERKGVEQVAVFLGEHGISAEIVDKVAGCILATSLPQHPQGLLEQIVCDADLYHLGTRELFTRDISMRKEVETRIGCTIDEAKWVAGTIKLLESHHYHTSYCQATLLKQKRINLEILKTQFQTNL